MTQDEPGEKQRCLANGRVSQSLTGLWWKLALTILKPKAQTAYDSECQEGQKNLAYAETGQDERNTARPGEGFQTEALAWHRLI